jgi:hypothetical protein
VQFCVDALPRGERKRDHRRQVVVRALRRMLAADGLPRGMAVDGDCFVFAG